MDNGEELKLEDVRKADNDFVDCVSKTTGDDIMKNVILALFEAKRIGEDMGILDFTKFVRGGT
jgi:hypothetical protein